MAHRAGRRWLALLWRAPRSLSLCRTRRVQSEVEDIGDRVCERQDRVCERQERRIEEVRALLREAVNDALSAHVVIAAEPLQDVR